MEDIPAGGTAGILEEALALAGKGRLGDAARARLWALAAEGAIAPETAHALVALDTEARGKEAKASPVGRPASQASRREEIRLAWAHAVPWALRGRMELPLATWAVLGMLIARARFSQSEWRAELSLTELQRRLGGAARDTVAGAVSRLEKAGLVRAIRRRRNPRFNEVNVYVLEHPEAARAASETPWREEEMPEARGAVERSIGRPGAPEASSGPPQAPGRGERSPARPGGSHTAGERPSRAPLVSPRWESKPAPGEGPRATSGAPKHAGSPPVSNSPPSWTHSHPKEDSTTKLQGNRPVAHNRPPSPHPPEPRTATQPSCNRQQEYKRHGPPLAGPPEERKSLPEPLPEPVVRALARTAAAELGEELGDFDYWRIAEGLLEGEMPEFDRAAWEKARARHGTRAALAVIETALIVRIRSATEDPVRSAPAYLGGILRREPADCRPEVTLQRLAAARAAMPGGTGAAGAGNPRGRRQNHGREGAGHKW